MVVQVRRRAGADAARPGVTVSDARRRGSRRYTRPMRSITHMLAAAALLAACASAEFTPSGGGEPLPPYTGEVAVLERLPPPGAYRLLGIVRAEGVQLTSDERLFESVKAMAAARGADAVVPQAPVRVRSTGSGGEERTLAAYAIRRR